MPTLDDIRAKIPDELSGLDDANAVKYIQQNYYPNQNLGTISTALGIKPAAPPAPNQFTSGFGRAFSELPGLAAGVGAYGADVVGATDTRDKLLGYAKKANDASQADHGQDAASFTDAWDGKVSWGDFLKNAAGYVAGQAIQSLATGGFGSLVGRQLAKAGVRELAEQVAAREIAAGATETAATQAAAKAVSARLTAGTVAGAGAGGFAHNEGMELGSIYPDAVDQAKAEGRDTDAGDLARVGLSSVAAAGVDTAAEAINARLLLKGSAGAGGIMARAAREIPSGIAREAGTEAVQTAIEHYGAGQPIADAKGLRDIIDSAAVGAVGGGGAGLGGSLHRRDVHGTPVADPTDPVDPTTPAPVKAAAAAAVGDIMKASNLDEALDAFQRARLPPVTPTTRGPDGDAALARLRDAQDAQAPTPTIDPETGELIAAPTFKDRLAAVKAQLEDSRVRQHIRETSGPEALNDLLYYASSADNPNLPGVTSDKMVALAESLLARAQVTPVPGTGGAVAPQVGGPGASPLQIGVDTTPTGRMLAGQAGVSPETRADVISAADSQRNVMTADAAGNVATPAAIDPRAQPVQNAAQTGTPSTAQVAPVDNTLSGVETVSTPEPVTAAPAASPIPGAPMPQGAFKSAADAQAYLSFQRQNSSISLPASVPQQFADGSWGVTSDEKAVAAQRIGSLSERAAKMRGAKAPKPNEAKQSARELWDGASADQREMLLKGIGKGQMTSMYVGQKFEALTPGMRAKLMAAAKEEAGVDTAGANQVESAQAPQGGSTPPTRSNDQAPAVSQPEASEAVSPSAAASPAPQSTEKALTKGEQYSGRNAAGATISGEYSGDTADGRVKLKSGSNTHYVDRATVEAAPSRAELQSIVDDSRGRFRELGDEAGTGPKGVADARRITGLNVEVQVKASTRMGPNTPAAFSLDDRTIYYNPAVKQTRAQWAQSMAEELLHAVDAINGNVTISATSPRLGVSGDIRTEAQKALAQDSESGRFLGYPLDAKWGLSQDRIAAELFARLGVLYNADPAQMREQLPLAHKVYSDAYSALRTQRAFGNDGVREEVRRDAEPSSVSSDAERVARRSAQQDPGSEGAPDGERLRGLRQSLADGLDGSAEGTVADLNGPLATAPSQRAGSSGAESEASPAGAVAPEADTSDRASKGSLPVRNEGGGTPAGRASGLGVKGAAPKLNFASDRKYAGPDSEPFKRWSNNAPLVRSGEAAAHEFKTGQKVVVEAFHGTGRPDRVGEKFLRKRATSGPMAYFTSDPEIASNYATGKPDTSLNNEDTDFGNWFKVKMKGDRSSTPIDRVWYRLTPEQRSAIAERMSDIRLDDENNVIFEKGGGDLGNYEWELKQTQRGYDRGGNPLKAAMVSWLESGAIFDDEQKFMDVLRLAGFPMDSVTYDSPHDAFPYVYKTFVAMQSPLVVGDVPLALRAKLTEAAKRDRSRAKDNGGDAWDKNKITMRDWVGKLSQEDAQYAWTQIPDKVSDFFREQGYDGIIDTGGKGGGKGHLVYIPFGETQVKSAIGNRGTFDPEDKRLNFAAASPVENPSTVEHVQSQARALFGQDVPGSVTVVSTASELPEGVRQGVEGAGALGVTVDGVHVYIVADRIEQDGVRGVLMHELGVHSGMPTADIQRLTKQVDSWAAGDDPKLAAMAQWAKDAAAASKSADRGEETLAHMVQALVDSGVDVNEPGAVGRFMRFLRNALQAAARALGIKVEMTPEDVVSYAFGAAKNAIQRDSPFNATSPVASMNYSAVSNVAAKLRQFDQPQARIVGETQRVYSDEQRAAMRNVGFETTPATVESKIKEAWTDIGKRMTQGIVDQFAPVKEISEKAYGLLRLSKGAAGAFEAFLRGGHLKISDGVYDFDESKRGGVVDKLLTPLQGEHHDFLRWVAANRAERLSAAGKENLFTADDISALKSLSDGVAPFDYTLKNGANAGAVTRDRTLIYADSLRTFNDFSDNVLDMAEQSGLIDGEARKLWQNEFYVPFYRVEDDGSVAGADIKNSAVRQEAFKSLTGRKNKLNADLLDNTLMNWAHLIDASAKNRAAKATLEAAENMGGATQVDGPSGPGTVWFRESGAKRYSFVSDPYLLTAVSALQYAGFRSPIMQVMGSFKRALTMGVTSSPFFKVRNLIRDSVQVIGTSSANLNVAANIAEGWKNTDPHSDSYFKLLAGGGTIKFGSMLEGSEAKRVQRLVEAGVDDSSILDGDSKVKAFYRKVVEPMIDSYQELGERGEAINRAALYAQLIKRGVSHADASLQARDLMDFSLQGSFNSIRFLTQVVPFFNARLQGMYKLGRAAKEDPARFATVVGGTAGVSIALMLAAQGDDDWDKREDWDRNNFWWFKVGGAAFRIPKPFEIGAIATLGERSFELAFSKQMTGVRFRDQVLSLLSNNLSMNPIPQLVKPVLDVYANKDSFTGRPIETMGMEKQLPQYRFDQNTSMLARGLSSAANAVTGTVGAGAPSPVQIDHMLQGYFGWLGSFVVGSADTMVRAAIGEPARPSPDYWKVASGSMISDLRDAPSRYVSAMYDQATQLEQAYGTYQALRKAGKTEEASDFAAANRDALALYPQTEAVKKAEAKIGAKIRAVQADTSLDAGAKREAIRGLREQQDRAARRLAPN